MEINSVTTHTARAVESARANNSLPSHLSDDKTAENLMLIITEYYNALNEEVEKNGVNNTFLVNNLTINHDIDLCSEEYLESIRKTIAAGVPTSKVLDKRRLYKIIAKYYLTRGSDKSIYAFFRIFYNEIVTLIFPKDKLFNSSGDKSTISGDFKIIDSYYWQEFSYVIDHPSDTAEWVDEYLKFVHPAGLKLFLNLSVISITYAGRWMGGNDSGDLPPGFEFLIPSAGEESPLPDSCDYWKLIDWERFFGKYAPRFQACTDKQIYYLFKVLMNDGGKHYLTHIRNVYSEFQKKTDESLLRAFYVLYCLVIRITNHCPQLCLHHNVYLRSEKFRDSSGHRDGYGSHTIESTYDSNQDPVKWDPGAKFQYKGYGVDITISTYTYGSIDYESGTGDNIWITTP